jgi:preprotein translocase subunit SecF
MDYTGKPINFIKYQLLYFVISALVIVPGIYYLITHGLTPAIDFTGGSLIEIAFENKALPSESQIIPLVPEGIEIATIQTTSDNTLVFRTKPISATQNETLKQTLSDSFGPLEELRFETIGPTLGQELLRKTLTAVVLASSAILLYIAYRFKNIRFGFAAIIAMFHDSLVVLGVFAFLGANYGVEVDTLFVTALLTILSLSVHDTIVVFDRVRESQRSYPKVDLVDLVNKAINETLARSINNSMTIIFMLLALWLMGGDTIKWFVFALLIGTITATHSSTFIAPPLMVFFDKINNKKR